MSLDFRVLTSIRSDTILFHESQDVARTGVVNSDERQYYLLALHRDRLVQACKAFHRDSKVLEGAVGLDKLKRELEAELMAFTESDKGEAPIKLRLEFTDHQDFHVTASYVPTVPLGSLCPKSLDQVQTLTSATYRVFVSQLRSTPSLFTKHKTTNRAHYEVQRGFLPSHSALGREAGILQEILLVNDSRGEIMEGTITTPYFFRNGEWITPSEGCGGHLGVTRRWALMRSLAKEGIILAEDVKIDETVILSNGVRGFGWGRIETLEA